MGNMKLPKNFTPKSWARLFEKAEDDVERHFPKHMDDLLEAWSDVYGNRGAAASVVSSVAVEHLDRGHEDMLKSLLAHRMAGWAWKAASGERWMSPAHSDYERGVYKVVSALPGDCVKVVELTMLCLEGRRAGYSHVVEVSEKFCLYMLSKQGFGRAAWEEAHPEDVGGCLVAGEYRAADRGRFRLLPPPPSVPRSNSTLFEKRRRGCVLGLTDSCRPCWAGRDACPLSRIDKSLPVGQCANARVPPHKGRLCGKYCMWCHRRARGEN